MIATGSSKQGAATPGASVAYLCRISNKRSADRKGSWTKTEPKSPWIACLRVVRNRAISRRVVIGNSAAQNSATSAASTDEIRMGELPRRMRNTRHINPIGDMPRAIVTFFDDRRPPRGAPAMPQRYRAANARPVPPFPPRTGPARAGGLSDRVE